MTDVRNIEEKIVAFSSGVRFSDLPSVGVAFAAYDAPTARIARRLAQPTSGDLSARVWGSQVRTTLESAAFANGVMVRYLDLNDAWRTKDAHHPSDYLPGILAVAEYRGASGEDFIAALAVAYEIVCRFTDVVPFNTAGWDQPVTGAIATAMAAGRLLGLSREALMHALALAVIPNLCTYQTRAGELSMWKGCAGPNGARNGVFAALLAGEGMSGPYEAFDGVFGVWNQTLGGTPYDGASSRPTSRPIRCVIPASCRLIRRSNCGHGQRQGRSTHCASKPTARPGRVRLRTRNCGPLRPERPPTILCCSRSPVPWSMAR